MSEFAKQLKKHNPGHNPTSWVFVPYDQLTDRLGPLSRCAAGEVGIVMVETPQKADRRPYHKQKLALILANMRHFALEQAKRGVQVAYLVAAPDLASTLSDFITRHGSVSVMEPAEHELRAELADVPNLKVIPHEGWLTTNDDFRKAAGKGPPWRMDAFYRQVRKRTNILMEDGKPVGGKYSFDAENRKPWKGDPPAPKLPTFEPDVITLEVGELIERQFAKHPGRLDLSTLPATREDANTLWQWALRECLVHFGPYEDAMSATSPNLFHSRVSAVLNLHRITPQRVIDDVLAADLPLASREGFVRQVLGWREFMRHVHIQTEGFRKLKAVQVRDTPGDAGYAQWAGPWRENAPTSPDGGAAPSKLEAHRPLPAAYWGAKSGLNCLDIVVAEVMNDAYSHHITRLMVLGNIATLLDVEPRELTDWFWVAYVDAFDWVVEPNVLGMATFGVGDLFTTKPYVSGANYIAKMSDYCETCAFDPKTTCPLTRMYWAFLARHEALLTDNHRMSLIMGSLRRRSEHDRATDAATFETVSALLSRHQTMSPKDFT